LPRLQRIGE